VARKMCRKQDLFPNDLAAGEPWDPLKEEPDDDSKEVRSLSGAKQALPVARQLRHSAGRRIWRTLLSFSDWPSYIWILLLASVILSLPYTLHKANKRANQQKMVLTAIAETSPVYRKILDLLQHGSITPLGPAPYSDVEKLEPTDFTGFEIISDTRIFDLRRWGEGTDSRPAPSVYTQVRVRRKPDAADNTRLRFQLQTVDVELSLFCRTESLKPALSRMKQPDGTYLWELALDFSHVPLRGDTEVVLEGSVVSDMAAEKADEGHFKFTVPIDTGLVQIWMLMPQGREYDYFEIIGYPISSPELAQIFEPDSKVELPLGSIATFRFVDPDDDYRYECRWKWSEEAD
jgi:hypothetical protein